MKVIHHSVFAESRSSYPLMSVISGGNTAQRVRDREKVREKAEAFINEIGVGNVVSITESASTLGPFSVVVWWHQEAPDTETPETLVIRAAGESKTP